MWLFSISEQFQFVKKNYERICIVNRDIIVSWIEKSQCIKRHLDLLGLCHDTTLHICIILFWEAFFFLFHSLIATSSKIYQMMALLINILFAKKKKNNFPWNFDKRFVPAKSLIHWELPIEEKLTTLDTWLISLILYK